jgi:hypothetical protein
VRCDREAPARTTGEGPCPDRVGSPWPWTVLAWAALLAAIVVSFRPAVPVIWGDTPSFVESAFRTLEAGRPSVAGGRDPGYPTFLAVTFAFGGDLGTAVRLQQAAWAVLMLALAAAVQAATRNAAGLAPIILVAMYPGLLLFTNVLTAELLFAFFLNLAMAGLLVATCVGNAARCRAVAASVLCAALAACFRSQGILVPIAAVLVGARLARPDTSARLAMIAVSVAAALALLSTGSRFGASASDNASVLFVPKTLVCNHPQDEQIRGTDAEHHYRMPVQAIEYLAPSRPREKFAHGQRVNVADAPVIEITRTRVMERMASSPEIVRSQGHDTDGSADPIVCKTAVEEGPVAAVVLDHEETYEEARRGCHQQQPSPITMIKSRPHQSPDDNERHCRDHKLEYAAHAVRLAITGEQVRQRAGFWWAVNHL